jgi:hypothetical protein
MTDTDSDYDDDFDPPFVGPEIRESYEAALGRFLLAFNEIDNRITELIERLLNRLHREDLINQGTKHNFALKLLVLDLLKTSHEGDGVARVPIKQLQELASHRNKLAHGHFDQNLIDGTYEVVSKDVSADYPVEKLEGLTAEAQKANYELRCAEGYYAFKDAPPADPEAQNRITGAPRGFERACYAVKAHGDGTGTIVLDWYEMSIGRDFMNSQSFMRTEIETAHQIVRLLNAHVPGRVHGITEYDASADDASSAGATPE